MQLSKASAYASLAVVYISEDDTNDAVGGRSIAEAHGIPPEYLLKILQQLVRSRVLRSETGRRGGYSLRKLASETTLLEIVEAIDGPILAELSVPNGIKLGESATDRIASVCEAVAEYARRLLGETTIQHLQNSK